MSCSRYERTLFLHAHGQLSGPRRWIIESHLHACSICRSRWARWCVEKDHFSRAFTPLPTEQPGSGSLADLVAARIRAERTLSDVPAVPRSGPDLGARLMLSLITGAALLVLAVSALGSIRPPAPRMPYADAALPLAVDGPTVTPVGNVKPKTRPRASGATPGRPRVTRNTPL
jgi:anti-sigma factor RsiW